VIRLLETRKAFTLIELLIVVAIIAILAAIAVPNFLEAQTRSKVSRAKSDMRSIATALESYFVDNNAYPIGFATTGTARFTVDSTYRTINPRIQRLVPVTTPIAYMTSVPQDVFSKETSTTRPLDEIRAFLYADRASYVGHVPQALGPGASGSPAANIYRIMWGSQYPSSQWLLRSRGPFGGVSLGQETGGLGTSVDARDAYDPTNGTVSVGNIFLLGPGVGFI
jgi:type II secretion system protein G